MSRETAHGQRGFIMLPMPSSGSDAADLAQLRLDNALALFDEFVAQTVKTPDAAALRGLERRFAEQLLIQPSYWSQIKSRTRQIGERLARQFEVRCHKPPGWMDVPHDLAPAAPAPATAATSTSTSTSNGPQDDDERFIVSLVLSYYRRDPRHAKARLLQLLGEALDPAPAPSAPRAPVVVRPLAPVAPAAEEPVLWANARQGVAPLKRRR